MQKQHRYNIKKNNNNNTFISISIFFKVFKNLCINENDETLFKKKSYDLSSVRTWVNLDIILVWTLVNSDIKSIRT